MRFSKWELSTSSTSFGVASLIFAIYVKVASLEEIGNGNVKACEHCTNLQSSLPFQVGSLDGSKPQAKVAKSFKNAFLTNAGEKMDNLLSSPAGEEEGRTFLIGPILAAGPMMLAEVLAIGGMGIIAPLFVVIPLVAIPLAVIMFIIYI